MKWSTNLYLRWAATAAIVLLTIMIGVRWAGRERPPDARIALVVLAYVVGAKIGGWW